MAGTKHFKVLQKRLAQLGYRRTGSSAGGSMWTFGHESGHEITVNPSVDENASRQIIRTLDRQHQQAKKAPKRNAAAIKERQAQDRIRLQEESVRLEAERLRISRQRDDYLGGAGAHLTASEIAQIEQRVREIEVRTREIQRLMGAPTVGVHQGTRPARHESGQRS